MFCLLSLLSLPSLKASTVSQSFFNVQPDPIMVQTMIWSAGAGAYGLFFRPGLLDLPFEEDSIWKHGLY